MTTGSQSFNVVYLFNTALNDTSMANGDTSIAKSFDEWATYDCIWWKSALMKSGCDEKLLRWKATSMKSRFAEKSL